MIELHQVDYKAAGLDSLGKGRRLCCSSDRRLDDRFPQGQDRRRGGFRKRDGVAESGCRPKTSPPALQPDFRFDNVVLNPDNPFEVISVLDWEMATLGDPLMDLGQCTGLLGAEPTTRLSR